MMTVDRNTFRFEERRKCPELNRGILREAEGHVNERHLRFSVHSAPRMYMVNSANALLAGDGSKRFKFTISLRRHVKIAFREAVDFVCPYFHFALPPREIEIRVVPL